MAHSEFLHSIAPARDELLKVLRPHLTDSVILEMAQADVPIQAEVSANREVLTKIRDTAIVPGCLPWNPGEVCNLLRWEKKSPDRTTSLIALFGCWILVSAYIQLESSESGNVEEGDEHTLAGLIENTLALGGNFTLASAQFVYWAYLSLLSTPDHRHEMRPFYLFALLILSSVVDELVSNEDLGELLDRLENEERTVRTSILKNPIGYITSESKSFPIWLLGLSGDDLNNFQNRYRKVTEDAVAILVARGDTTRAESLRKLRARLNS